MKTVKQTQMHNQVCVDEAGDAAEEEAHRAEAHRAEANRAEACRAEACRAEACRETTHLAKGVADGVVDGQIIRIENQKVSVL